MNVIEKVFGTHSERELKRIRSTVDKIESLRPQMQALSDDELRGKTREYKNRLQEGETLDDLLPEAFATVREAAKRVLGMEHYRVQLIGGIVLHQGRIAEMKTGEGKTLVSTLPAYLNALTGEGVHIVTVNDYLAKRDAEWMGKVHEFLGLTVGVVLNQMDNDERRAAYNCDITYVTNNELGFDYLRDNMVIYKEQLVQRGMKYALIDEVDSVLIDEARTPLIISGQSGKSTRLYEACDVLARQLERGEASGEFSKMNAIMGEEIEETGDFIVNEKEKNVSLTEDGVKKVEKFFQSFGNGTGMSSNSVQITEENGKTKIKIDSQNSDMTYIIDGQQAPKDNVQMPDKILNVNIIPSKEDVKKSYLFITSRDRLGEFVSFQNGVLTFIYNSQEYKYNLEKMKEPLLVIDGRLADRFDIDPSEILQIRPISPIEKEVGYYPNAEVIINTK